MCCLNSSILGFDVHITRYCISQCGFLTKTTCLLGCVLPPSKRTSRTQLITSTMPLSPLSSVSDTPPAPVSTPIAYLIPSDNESDDEPVMTSTSDTQKKGPACVTAGTSIKNCPKISEGALTYTLLKHFLTAITNW